MKRIEFFFEPVGIRVIISSQIDCKYSSLKIILNSWATQKQVLDWIWPAGYSSIYIIAELYWCNDEADLHRTEKTLPVA